MSIVPVSVPSGQPLAPMQRSLWMSQRLHPDAPVQNMALLTHLDGPVDPDRLADAFDVVVAASDVLRTRIADEGGSPLVHLDAAPQPREILRLPRAEAEAWARRRATVPIGTSVRGYDSVVLVHDDDPGAVTLSWYLALHHTITDATSSALVFAATAAVYHGQPRHLGSYYDWARRNTEGTADEGATKRFARARDHWRQRRPAAPVDRLYQPVRRARSEAPRIDVDLGPALLEAADARLSSSYRMLSADLGWTALLMTATAVHLWSVGGIETMAIGLPVHNRSDAATRDLIGPIMEVFPVDVSVEEGDTFATLHKRVGRSIMKTLANAVPGTAPTADYAAVVNVIARAGVGSFGDTPTTTTWVHSGAIDSSHLLRVQYTAYDQTLALDVNRSGADDRHRTRAVGHFRSLLAAMLADPERPLSAPDLDPDEVTALARWESSDDFSDSAPGLVDTLRAGLAERTTVALRDGAETMTGAELWRRALSVADWLRERGVRPGDRVGIELARSTDAVIAIIATLVTGGSFVPLPPDLPERRRRRLADRAGVALVVDRLPTPPSTGQPETSGLDHRSPDEPDPEHEAYLLFTSGSTGEPKGVPISHRGLARYLHFARASYLDPATKPVAPLFSALSFDLTMTSLFLPLLAGGELVVIRPDGPAGLSELAAQRRINWCKATPSHLEILARVLTDDHELATVVVGGEAFGAGLARRLLAGRPHLAIFNEYGPTEAVVGCMIHRVDPSHLDRHQEVPIGIPAPGVTLRVVGRNLERLPLGAAGELCISHPGLTEGYLDATVEEPGPFVELDGERFYRSGDLVRLVPDGPGLTALYLGRIDEQVKVGGIRLEPTEVADAIAAHPAIDGAAVRLWSPNVAEPTRRCVRCGLASNVPGVVYDDDGLCSACHDYDRVAPQVEAWFRTIDDLATKRDEARRRRTGRYDCLHLLSGGKDSTYALYRLVDEGFEPYVLTLDNGFISQEALDNARRSVAELGLDHELATSDVMNEIFRDSLERHSNVCHGCYKTLYTLATTRAVELGIPLVVTGLSRGQLFETRLLPQQFAPGRFDPEAIDRAIIEARKTYHRLDDGPNRLLDTSVFATDDVFDDVEYLDFYRYVDVPLAELYAYLDANAPWVRPSDTGRSTNCLINAAGIYTHLQEQGYHNYAIPYAWDVRLGHKTRTEAIEELDDRSDQAEIDRLLGLVGYTPNPPQTLTAWIEPVTAAEVPTPAELRAFLSESLPAHAVPQAFVTVDRLPLNANGKLDAAALPPPDRTHRTSTGIHLAPTTELEATIVAAWERILRIEPIGVDDDFFALGGDSLAALEMSVVVGEALDWAVPDDFAFLHTTPRQLAGAIESLGDEADAPPPTVTGPPETPTDWTPERPPPLSAGELAILYEQATRPDAVMYNVGRLYRIAGPVDVARFTDALRRVAANHVPLSWTFGATRRPLTATEAVSVDHHPESIAPTAFDDLARAFHRTPFDLDGGPLLKALVRSIEDGSTAILLVCHHVSGDAESFERLWPQIDTAYCGGEPTVPTLDYPSFTAWQLDALTDDDQRFWLDRASEPTPLALGPPSDPGNDGFITIEASVSPRLLKARSGTSGFATALAALTATLRRYGHGDQPALSMIASARNHPVAEPLVGYFLNTLPVDLACRQTDRLGDLATRAGSAVAANLAHRSYPYGRIVADRRSAGERGRGRPGDELLVVYEKLPTTTLAGSPVEQTVLSPGTAVADATFFITEHDDRIGLGLEYRGSFLDETTADRLLRDLDSMLTAVVEQPEAAVADITLASSEASVIVGPPLDAPASLLPAIERHLIDGGDRVAVEAGDAHLSWRQLDARSTALAQVLLAAGVGRGDRVIINSVRSPDLVAAIVATLRIGAAYVPIDTTYPRDRVALIAAHSGARAALMTAPDPEAPLTANDLAVDDVQRRETGGSAPAWPTIDADDLAYLIFTSGSTGTPRGVPVSHGQLAASTTARNDVYERSPDRFLMVSSPSFDSSVVGLFWTLATGGTIVLPTDGQSRDPDELVALFGATTTNAAPTHTLLVPTLYQALLERGRDQAGWPGHTIVAGESCPAHLVDRHFELRPSHALTNEYGPTETTVWATAEHLTAGAGTVAIGSPIPGTWLAVVDDQGRPVPAGVQGQLIIGGQGVVDGYDADDDATAQRFGATTVDPTLGHHFGTGDRAVAAEGKVWFLGREDHRLNVGGVRAEPEDIERVLQAEPSVGVAVVTVHDPRPLDELIDQADPARLSRAMEEAATHPEPAAELRRLLRSPDGPGLRLAAHLEPSGPAPIDLAAVRSLASAGLPSGLRPSVYGLHDALPRTANGKIDRSAAADLTPSGLARDIAATDRPGMGPLDDRLAAMFASTLGLDEVGPEQSFFDLGGHSLLAMELLLRLERELQVDVTVSSLYENPSPRALARLVETLTERPTQNRFLIPIQPDGNRPPIFAVHVLGVNAAYYRPLAAHLGSEQPLYGLGQPTLDLDTSTPTDVAEIARLYREELTACAPEGPVTLTAVSLGAVVAFELAQQLRRAGRAVALLALFDAAGPDAARIAPSGADRLSLHVDELRRNPAAYARGRVRRLTEAGTRRRDILMGRARAAIGLPLSDELRIRHFIEENWRSQLAYTHAPYDGAVTVFKAADDPFNASLADRGMGWSRVVTGRLDVLSTPGGHLSMLAEPHVATLAETLTSTLTVANDRALAAASAIGAGPLANPEPSAGQSTEAELTEAQPTEAELTEAQSTEAELTEAELTDALYRGTLGVAVARRLADGPALGPEAAALLAHVDETTRALASEAETMGREACQRLSSLGIGARIEPVPERLQHLTVGVRLVDADGTGPTGRREAAAAVHALESLGYRPQDRLSPGAWEAQLRAAASCTLIRSDASTSRLMLSWANPEPVGPLQPRRADLTALALPRMAWPAYYGIRPVRLLADRLQGRVAGGHLGVFLGTPRSMVGEILALAEPSEDDVIVDVGCGDGRVLIEAAKRYGCSARGVEIDPGLVAEARASVSRAGLDHLVTVHEGNAANAEDRAVLGEATVVFLFLPAETTARLLRPILDGLGPSGRVVAHEQLDGAWPIAPDRSQLIVNGGITVAHRWNVC